MPDNERGKKMVTAKLDADVHIMLKILTKRYKSRVKGKVSISDAARFFMSEHEPDLAETAKRQAEEQDELANDDD
jgi:hypothetical protein